MVDKILNILALMLLVSLFSGCGADPGISGEPAESVEVGQQYLFTPTTKDLTAPLEFSIQNKPEWITFDPETGGMTGTPGQSDVGVNSGIVISVTAVPKGGDSPGTYSLAPFDITVLPAQDASDLVINEFHEDTYPPVQSLFWIENKPDGKLMQRYEWDLDGDGVFEKVEEFNEILGYTFASPGLYQVQVKGVDIDGVEYYSNVISVSVDNYDTFNDEPFLVANKHSVNAGEEVELAVFSGAALMAELLEWDFDGDGVYDRTVRPFLGFLNIETNKVYESSGVFVPRARITFSSGVQRVVEIHSGPIFVSESGSPVVDIVSTTDLPITTIEFLTDLESVYGMRANITQGYESSVQSYEWYLSGSDTPFASEQNITYQFPYMDNHVIRLVVTLNDGTVLEDRQFFQGRPSYGIDFEDSDGFFDPAIESDGFNFQLISDAKFPYRVSVVDPDNRLVKQLTGFSAPTGTAAPFSQSVSWDGRNEEGQAVSPGIYFVVVDYMNGETMERASIDYFGVFKDLQLNPGSTVKGTPIQIEVDQTKYDAFHNKPLEVTLKLDNAARVTGFAGAGPVRLKEIMDGKYLPAGDYKFYWAGISEEKILYRGQTRFGFWENPIPRTIYVNGLPNIGKVTIQPEIFNPPINRNLEFAVNVDRLSDVKVVIADVSSGSVFRELLITNVAPGESTHQWNGKDESGNYIHYGSYSMTVSAINSHGSSIESTALFRVTY